MSLWLSLLQFVQRQRGCYHGRRFHAQDALPQRHSLHAGRVRVAEKWTDILGAPLAIIHKRRDPDTPNEVRVFEVVGDVRDRICIVVDDMIDTGGTIVKAADTLFENGAAEVIVAATHGILSEPAAERLQDSRISEVIYEVFTDGSVTRMFETPERIPATP